MFTGHIKATIGRSIYEIIDNSRLISHSAKILLLLFIIPLSSELCQANTIIIEQGESIQAAIDEASPGDTIEIKCGMYKESINISKRLILYGMDNGTGKPIIFNEEDHNRSVVILSANGCTIQGLMINGFNNCALAVLSDFNKVNGNIITGNDTGIYLDNSDSNIISCNNINFGGNLKYGLFITHSFNNIIDGNNIGFNGILASGIDLVDSNRNTISDNKVKGNGWIGGAGISCLRSDSNSINNNTIKTRGLWGSSIFIKGSTNNILDNNEVEHRDFSGSGITLWDSNRNHIMHNTAEGKGQLNCAGIFLRRSKANHIISNKISSTGTYGSGVSLIYSEDNELNNNEASNSSYGVYLYTSKDNIVNNNTAQYNSDHDIFIDFFSPHNSIRHNVANIYIIEPRWSQVENNIGQVKEFTVEFPDQVPIITLSDLVDIALHISQFILSLFGSN